ncbi:MAG: cupin domain-containing protein [Actinomycetota bacterium]
MPTFAVRASGVTMEPEELDRAQVVSGDPRTAAAMLWESEDGRILRGVWECTPGVATDVEQDELFVILQGRATVEVEGGSRLELEPGVVGVLERSARTRWSVQETIRKVFQITLPD